MYQFSRSLYRELAPEVIEDKFGSASANRARLLGACEGAVERLATDRHYFARPARTLFNDVRMLFPMSSQLRVYRLIEGHMVLATAFVDRAAAAGLTLDGTPLACHATTRRGTECQRIPLPGHQYCPSHRHLEEGLEQIGERIGAAA
jgi:hypothetical protein